MGFGLVVSVVVPSTLAVLPYARGRGFVSRSRLLLIFMGVDKLMNYMTPKHDFPLVPSSQPSHVFFSHANFNSRGISNEGNLRRF
jgi:hypothetical protein